VDTSVAALLRRAASHLSGPARPGRPDWKTRAGDLSFPTGLHPRPQLVTADRHPGSTIALIDHREGPFLSNPLLSDMAAAVGSETMILPVVERDEACRHFLPRRLAEIVVGCAVQTITAVHR